LHLLSPKFGKYLVDVGDLGAFYKSALEVCNPVAQKHNSVYGSLVVLLPVENSLLDDFFELKLSFVRVA